MELLVICFTLLPNCASNINHTQQVQLVNPKKRSFHCWRECYNCKNDGGKKYLPCITKKIYFPFNAIAEKPMIIISYSSNGSSSSDTIIKSTNV